jgi:hypothetical protein
MLVSDWSGEAQDRGRGNPEPEAAQCSGQHYTDFKNCRLHRMLLFVPILFISFRDGGEAKISARNATCLLRRRKSKSVPRNFCQNGQRQRCASPPPSNIWYYHRHLVTKATRCFLLLPLIRAAGGVNDFRNFEEVFFCNGLSSDLQNLCIPQKTSREYILLSTFERKTAFSAIYKPKCSQDRPLLRHFRLFRAALKSYLASVIPSTTTPGPGTPPINSRCTKQFWSCPRGL